MKQITQIFLEGKSPTLKLIWIITLKVWKINFDFKDKFVDSKYSYRFEIVFCRFQNVTADFVNGSRFEFFFFSVWP